MSATKPTSDVAICNLSLDYLKESPITSIENPTSKPAERCARHYHLRRLATLRKHPWNFATKRVGLAEADIDIAFGYDSAYALPSDFVRLVALGDDQLGILTSEDGELLMRYVYDLTNVSQFDPLFIETLALELAIGMAPSFNASDSILTFLKEELKRKAPVGYSVDGQERPPSRISSSRWISRRRGGRGSISGYGSPWVNFDGNLSSPCRYQVENGYILIGEPA